MKRICFLVLIFIIAVSNTASAGFLGDFFKNIGDSVKQGLQQGLGQGSPQGRQNDLKRAEQLYQEGIKLLENGRYEEAISRFKQALRIAKTYNISSSERLCLIWLGFSYKFLNQWDQAINYLEAALKIAVNGEDPTQRQNILGVLGRAYLEVKNYEKAGSYLKQSFALASKQKIAENEYFASCDLADFYEQTGDYENAIRLNEAALIIKKKIKQKMPSDTLQLHKLLNCANRMGDYDKAKGYLTRLFETTKKEGNKDLNEASYFSSLGFIHYQVGNYQTAISQYETAIGYARKSNDKVAEGECLNKMGEAYFLLGDYTESINVLKRSLAYGDDKSYLKIQGPSNFFIGAAYLRLGEYAEAIKYFTAAKEITENHKSEVNDYKSAIDVYSHEIGLSYLLEGNVKNAKKLLDNANNEYQFIFYLRTGQPEKAISMVKENIDKKRQDNTIDSLSDINNILLGLAYESMGDKVNAHNYYKRATELIENDLEEISDDQKINYMNSTEYPPYSRLTPYEGLIRISSEEESFYYSESVKARLLLAQIAKNSSSLNFNIPKKILEKENGFVENIVKLRKKRDALSQEYVTKQINWQSITEIRRQTEAVKKERDIFIKNLRKEYPEYAAIKYPRPLRLEQIAVHPGEVLIEYAVTESKTLAWVIKKGRIIKSISVDINKKELDDLIDRYREWISNPKSLKKPDFDSETGYRLYCLLIKNLLPHISPNDKIIIVPDKKLGLLPFETLIMNETVKKEMSDGKYGYYQSNLKYLGDDFEISYYQSASALTMMRTLKKWKRTEKTLFILSDPIFNSDDIRLSDHTRIDSEKKGSNLMRAVEDSTGLKLIRLDETSNLATNLLKIYNSKGTDHLTGKEASESNLRKKDLSKYKYVVFATHGLLDSKIAGIMEPALVLSQVGNKEGDNGFLTMSKVMGLRLNSDVTALTACETGTGKLVSGEGVMGLGRAFQYAGAKSVLASLWSVSEDSTVKLVEKFFYWQKMGKDRSTALKIARNDIKKEGYEHPFFWSPFILIGEGN